MEGLGERLRAERWRLGLSQAELGQRTGLAKSTISMYESGRREPDLKRLAALARCLEVPLQTLVGEGEALAPEEAALLAEYRALGEEARRHVRLSARLLRASFSVEAAPAEAPEGMGVLS